MAFHLCAIHEKDGTAVCAEVTVTLVEAGKQGGTGWYGTICATHLINLAAGQYYRLELDDGRVGEFRVRRNTFAGGEDRAVSIEGTRPLK